MGEAKRPAGGLVPVQCRASVLARASYVSRQLHPGCRPAGACPHPAILDSSVPAPRKKCGMPPTGYGAYQRLVFWALLAKAPAPWSAADRDGIEEIITEGFCAEDWPDLAHYEVLNWMRALSPHGRELLIVRCNRSWESSPEAWSIRTDRRGPTSLTPQPAAPYEKPPSISSTMTRMISPTAGLRSSLSRPKLRIGRSRRNRCR